MRRAVVAFEHLRTFALPDTGTVRIPSRDSQVPGLTALMLANLLHERGRDVAVETAWGTSLLVGRGPDAAWMHVRGGTP